MVDGYQIGQYVEITCGNFISPGSRLKYQNDPDEIFNGQIGRITRVAPFALLLQTLNGDEVDVWKGRNIARIFEAEVVREGTILRVEQRELDLDKIDPVAKYE